MLLYLGTDLLRAVRTRPLVSVAVSGDRYSVSYSVIVSRCTSRYSAQLPSGGVRPYLASSLS
jgi:hypothetical protein